MNISRKSFLSLAAAGGASAFAGCKGFPSITSCASPCGKLKLVSIGCGGRGKADIRHLCKHRRVEMSAFCDVDLKMLDPLRKQFPKARFYQNWREMLDAEGADAALVATPDHNHEVIMSEVLRRKMHLYAQKPLCRTLDECRRIEGLVNSTGVVTQLGSQCVSWWCDRYTSEIIRTGKIGQVKKVWLFSNTGVYQKLWDRTKPINKIPVPESLDWKGWLEGAPDREYAEGYHPFRWRAWKDFGSGWLGDMYTHILAPVWLGMELGKIEPLSVKAEVLDEGWSAAQKAQFLPQVSHVTWQYPGVKATGGKPFEVEWCDAPRTDEGKVPEQFLPPKRFSEMAKRTPLGSLPLQGRVVEGTEGTLFSTHYNTDPVIVKGGTAASGSNVVANADGTVNTSLPYLEPIANHFIDFIDCCLDGGEPITSLNWTCKLTETLIKGNMAIRKTAKF